MSAGQSHPCVHCEGGGCTACGRTGVCGFKKAWDLSAQAYYRKPDFYKRIEKALSTHNYPKKGDYAGLPKKVARKLAWLERSFARRRAMRDHAYEQLEAWLLRQHPEHADRISLAMVHLDHPEAHGVLVSLKEAA